MNTKNKRIYNFMVTATEEFETLESLAVKANKLPTADWAVITHDKDIGSTHYHLAIKLKTAMTITAISKQLKTPPNFIQKWDNRTYNLFAYLIHDTTNAKEKKHDYSDYLNNPDKFATNLKDFMASASPSPAGGTALAKLYKDVLHGKLTKKQLLSSELIETYHKNLHAFNNAIRLRTESLQLNPPNCTTMYIYGLSYTGKTHTANDIAKMLYKDNYTTASSPNDLLQQYIDEKCLIIDEFRPQDYPFNKLLALLEPKFRKKSHESRYYNKPLATELIIITSVIPVEETIAYYQRNPQEDMKQLRRRIQQVRHIKDRENYQDYIYDEQTDTYSPLKG